MLRKKYTTGTQFIHSKFNNVYILLKTIIMLYRTKVNNKGEKDKNMILTKNGSNIGLVSFSEKTYKSGSKNTSAIEDS